MAQLVQPQQQPRIGMIQDSKPSPTRFDSLDSSATTEFTTENDSYGESSSTELTAPSPTMESSETTGKSHGSNGTSPQALKELVREILKQERLEIQAQTNGTDRIDGLTSRVLGSYITELEKKIAALEKKEKLAEDTPKELANPKPIENGEKNDDKGGRPKLVVKRLRKETPAAAAVADQDDSSDGIGKEKSAADEKCILTVTRNIEKNNQKTLEIRSSQVIKFLRKVVKYYPGQALGGSMVSFVDPFMLLFHYRKDMIEELKNLELEHETRMHLEHVLEFMRTECPEVSLELDDLEEDEERRVISFANSWLIFAPGTIVYSTQESEDKDENEKSKVVVSSPEGEKRAYMVEELSGCDVEKLPSGREIRTSLKLRCWSMDFDGYRFGRTYTELYVRPFNGSREIEQLEVVPEKYTDPEIKDRLIERGRTFWQLKEKDKIFRLYTGKAWSKTSLADTLRVVVDHAAYSKSGNDGIRIEGVSLLQQEQVHCGCSECKEKRETARMNFERLDRVSPYAKYNSVEPDSEPDNLTLLLCPDRAYAFSLRDKSWKPVKLRDLKTVEFRKKAFDKLVMKKEYKATVQALVSTYTADQHKFRDLVEGKGRGLVLLLHGPPGTGKTLTAECVADEYQRPLYMVTCGDLGTEPWELEVNLRRIFKDATTWNAVLLLDEADIFLQMRDYKDVNRNALVSVFLRELEYFDGILFLTTNRVGAIDEAFQSRIHVTLGLPLLDEDSRRDIWKIFIKDLGGIHKDSRKELLKHVNAKLGKCNLNGRQIRNCVRTAIALADQAQEPISPRHLDAVVKMGEEFAEYMKTLQKMDAEEYQAAMGNRLASWKPKD